MNHRFRIGDRVRVTGILAEFYPGKTGNVHETLGYSPNSLPQSSTGRFNAESILCGAIF